MINKSFIDFASSTKHLKPHQFSSIVNYLSDQAIDEIGECVFNIIENNIDIPAAKKYKLKSHIKKKCCVRRIRVIGNRKIPLSKRRRAIKQEGKGLPLLLASIIPFIASLFRK